MTKLTLPTTTDLPTIGNRSRSSGVGLERSCDEASTDRIFQAEAIGGLELFAAWFQGRPYRRHRHDTYAISLTETGVQAFDYRGTSHVSLPGQVVVLHPDEAHDGRAGGDAGFGYRQVYVEPALVFEALQVLTGRACALPFVRDPVAASPKLATAIQTAFRDDREPLAIDDVVVQLADGLLEADPTCAQSTMPRRLDVAAIERARQFLEGGKTRVVRSSELESITGLTRFELSRQFRFALGTSPYRYLLMRRLALAREEIARHRPLVDVALETGFADQAHLTRHFTAAYGITPARYAALSARQRRLA